jgi:hypothetical protein
MKNASKVALANDALQMYHYHHHNLNHTDDFFGDFVGGIGNLADSCWGARTEKKKKSFQPSKISANISQGPSRISANMSQGLSRNSANMSQGPSRNSANISQGPRINYELKGGKHFVFCITDKNNMQYLAFNKINYNLRREICFPYISNTRNMELREIEEQIINDGMKVTQELGFFNQPSGYDFLVIEYKVDSMIPAHLNTLQDLFGTERLMYFSVDMLNDVYSKKKSFAWFAPNSKEMFRQLFLINDTRRGLFIGKTP